MVINNHFDNVQTHFLTVFDEISICFQSDVSPLFKFNGDSFQFLIFSGIEIFY